MISTTSLRRDWLSNVRGDVLAGIVVALALIRPLPRLRDPAADLRPASLGLTLGIPDPAALISGGHGFSLHAATRVDGADSKRLDALIRYVARPVLAQGRLKVRGDGKVKWTLRKPWRDGTRAFVFEPLSFLERLAALVPHPREHGWTYHGSLAPASTLRDRVVPRCSPPPREDSPSACNASPHRHSWAELLERTFAEDVLRCPRCGGRRHRIATITDPLVARRILRHIGARPLRWFGSALFAVRLCGHRSHAQACIGLRGAAARGRRVGRGS